MAERSLWGWGYENMLPDLQGVRQRVEPFLGALDASTPAPKEAVRIAPERVLLAAEIAPFANVDSLTRARHTHGKSYVDKVRGFGGDFTQAPDIVAMPTSEQDLDILLEVCARERLALVPYGGGTSVTGGVEAQLGEHHRGCVTVNMQNMGGVLELDATSMLARIGAGALGPAIEQALKPHDLTLRHFPQSFEFSTLGGWIATRAGGHFATLYTHVDDLVHSCRMLTPSGVWQSPNVPASGAGPDANRLVCGSEGTLGIITEAWMRVRPRPVFRARASVHFADFEKAVAAARVIAQSGLYPANCRLLDPKEAFINNVSLQGDSILIVAFESADHPVDTALARAVEICADHQGVVQEDRRRHSKHTSTQDAAGEWRAAFLQGPYLQDALICLGVLADTFETACRWSAFSQLYSTVCEKVEAALLNVCGGGLVSCRFTHVYPDGPAPYFTFIGRAQKGAEIEQWRTIKKAASDALAHTGGTITHHHAVGTVHAPWYERESPAPFRTALRAAKQAMDPHGILNPGKLLA